jgi:hypothetical protein
MFKIINLVTDSGLLLDTHEERTSFQFKSSTAFSFGPNPNYIFVVKLYISNIVETYTRRYLKLQTVLANVGGITKFFMIFLGLVNSYFANFSFKEKILLSSVSKLKKLNLNKTIPNQVSFSQSNDFLKADNFLNKTKKSPINFITIDDNEERKASEMGKIHNLYLTNHFSKVLNYKSFKLYKLCICSKSHNLILKKMEKIIEKEMDYLKLFKLSSKFNLTERILFGKEGLNSKNLLYHVSLVDNLINQKNHQKDHIKFKNINQAVEKLKNSRIVDSFKFLLEEFDQSINNITPPTTS